MSPSVTPFLSMPYLVGEFKITASLLEPSWIVPWPEGCSSGQKCHHDTGMQTDRHSGAGSATKLLSVLQYSCKHEKCYEISRALDQGLWCECLLWSTAAWSASESTFECPSWSGCTWALTSLPADRMDVLSFPDWTCSSYRLCSLRVQISFALFSFWKKAICFVYSRKSQKCKILKSLPRKLLSFKKRAIEIVILLSYCLMNLLSPRFSAQKWVLPCLKQENFFLSSAAPLVPIRVAV